MASPIHRIVCVLNICKDKGKNFHIEWAQDCWFGGLRRQPECAPVITGVGSGQAREIRDVLCVHVLALQGDVDEEIGYCDGGL